MHPLPRRSFMTEPQSPSSPSTIDFDTPASPSSSSSWQPLTPTSPFSRNAVIVMDEEGMDFDNDGIAGYSVWGEGHLLESRNKSHATAIEASAEMSACSISASNDFDDFWDTFLLPTSQPLRPMGGADVRDSYAFCHNSPYVTTTPLSPQHVSPSSSSFTPYLRHAAVTCQSRPIPLHQPQPVRPIPPIPITDISQAAVASEVTCPPSYHLDRHSSKPLAVVTRQTIHPSKSSLSENSLLCQPVSDNVRFQSDETMFSQDVWMFS
jgi:hypothetical protein